ncbi:MAG: DUF4920 domain-containing protein [Bacteroidales bacterium]|jgi:hypothetical protein
MKKLILTFIMVAMFFSGCDPTGKSNQTQTTIKQKEAITPVVQSDKLAAALDTTMELKLQLQGKILDVCTGSGCWLEMDMGDGQRVLVTFPKDVYVVDTSSIGKLAMVEGLATKEIISVKRLQLQAADEGASEEEINAINEPVAEYSFEASQVKIK